MNSVVISLLLICLTLLTINAEYTNGHNGRPHCQTNEEMDKVVWRNNNDPTSYWVCSNKDSPADHADCPEHMAFHPEELRCVPWLQWRWEDPINPPSVYYNEIPK